MQSVSSRIWTRVAVFISYDDNHYTTGTSTNKPNTYLRYSDNILLFSNSTDEINIIQETFQNNLVLTFTQEININNKIPFLGVLIDTSNIDGFTTSAYKKTYQNSSLHLQFP